MARLGGGFESSNLWILLIACVVGLYLFSEFMTKDTAGTWTFGTPVSIGATTLMVFKIIILGAISTGMFYIFVKLGKGSLTGRDFATIAVTMVAIWFLWDWFLADFLKSATLDDLATNLAAKTGFAGR